MSKKKGVERVTVVGGGARLFEGSGGIGDGNGGISSSLLNCICCTCSHKFISKYQQYHQLTDSHREVVGGLASKVDPGLSVFSPTSCRNKKMLSFTWCTIVIGILNLHLPHLP